MNDIVKCLGDNCEQKERCYRYTAAPDILQLWMETPKERPCEFFIEVPYDVWNERL